MSHFVQLPLEPGDYYLLHDWRSENQFLRERRAYDPDPAASAAITKKIEQLRRARNPAWSPPEPGKLDCYFDGNAPEIAPELVSKVSGYQIARPTPIPHMDSIPNWAEPYGENMRIVSAAWKSAMESFEPDVHRFYPHELKFRDGVVSNYFIVREGGVRINGPDVLVDEIEDAFSDYVEYRFRSRDGKPMTPLLSLDEVSGRHYLRDRDGWKRYVSRALAEKLYPLLPEYVCLLPVAVSGAAPGPKVSAWVAADGARTFRSRDDAPPVEPNFGDSRLADAFRFLSSPQASYARDQRTKAWQVIYSMMRRMPAEWAFALMKETFKFDGPLENNTAFLTCGELIGLLPERAVLPFLHAWADDSNPLVRYALVRLLWYRFFPGMASLYLVGGKTEPPSEELRTMFLRLSRDSDPRVQAFAIGCMLGLNAFDAELRPRLTEIANHSDSRVRYWATELKGRKKVAKGER